jgi:hypothetical protein
MDPSCRCLSRTCLPMDLIHCMIHLQGAESRQLRTITELGVSPSQTLSCRVKNLAAGSALAVLQKATTCWHWFACCA